jgi:hypothetical protein
MGPHLDALGSKAILSLKCPITRTKSGIQGLNSKPTFLSACYKF